MVQLLLNLWPGPLALLHFDDQSGPENIDRIYCILKVCVFVKKIFSDGVFSSMVKISCWILDTFFLKFNPCTSCVHVTSQLFCNLVYFIDVLFILSFISFWLILA